MWDYKWKPLGIFQEKDFQLFLKSRIKHKASYPLKIAGTVRDYLGYQHHDVPFCQIWTWSVLTFQNFQNFSTIPPSLLYHHTELLKNWQSLISLSIWFWITASAFNQIILDDILDIWWHTLSWPLNAISCLSKYSTASLIFLASPSFVWHPHCAA
jgi:hypothetical protein